MNAIRVIIATCVCRVFVTDAGTRAPGRTAAVGFGARGGSTRCLNAANPVTNVIRRPVRGHHVCSGVARCAGGGGGGSGGGGGGGDGGDDGG
jgi:hypothetical protein